MNKVIFGLLEALKSAVNHSDYSDNLFEVKRDLYCQLTEARILNRDTSDISEAISQINSL